MAYTLIGSERSPFARVCRMLMIQNSISFDWKVLNFVDDPKDAAVLRSETPINKVPLLLDGDRKVFDSRVIVNYLTAKHGLRKPSLEEENAVSVINSCLDAGVILFLMRKDGFDTQGGGFFLSRQRARVPEGLKYLTPWISSLDPSNPDHWNYASMSLYSLLRWGEARAGILRIADDPRLVSFVDGFKNAPGVRETDFQ